MSRTVSIRVPALTRVEGEGALELDVQDGRIAHLALRIFEPPRYFEKFLEGRPAEDVLDTVARICGICPVAYQMSEVLALEQALGVEVDPWVRAMRRVFYCGEWIQSHALHIHLLAAPDFLGYDSAIAMAKEHGELVRRGLRLQALGNAILAFFGGRSVHPVGARIGGFHRAPEPQAANELLRRLQGGLDDAAALAQWAAALDLPEDEQRFTLVSADKDPNGAYPMMGTELTSNLGLRIRAEHWEEHFRETHVPHSTALFCHLQVMPYLVGPLARLNLHHRGLHPATAKLLADAPLSLPSRNMFHSLPARALELHHALATATDLLAEYRFPERPYIPYQARAGEGYGVTEAPRGTLWHHYALDHRGHVTRARIVPPTSQNQARMEEDLRQSLERFGLGQDEERLRLHSETVIRNYDPCISCATHFLKLKIRS